VSGAEGIEARRLSVPTGIGGGYVSDISGLRLKLLGAAVVIGGLSLGGMATAGAAGTSAGPSSPVHPAGSTHALIVAIHHFSCPNGERALADVKALESRFTAKNARIGEHEAKMQASARVRARTQGTAYWQKTLSKQQRYEARVMNSKFRSRVDRVTQLVALHCQG
jgi:hypothetical protein